MRRRLSLRSILPRVSRKRKAPKKYE